MILKIPILKMQNIQRNNVVAIFFWLFFRFQPIYSEVIPILFKSTYSQVSVLSIAALGALIPSLNACAEGTAFCIYSFVL